MSDGIRSSEGSRRAFLRERPVLFLPLLLVNGVACWGQAGWAYTNLLPRSWVLAVAFAVALESIGVYLSQEAHDARMNDQAAGMLQLGAYAMGATAGTLNYLHFSHNGTVTGATFAILSTISPWLWAIRSRSMSRRRLTDLGQSDKRGVKLSTSRKVWHPVKSVQVIRWAAWAGVTNPDDAVAGWELFAQTAPVFRWRRRPTPDDNTPVSGGGSVRNRRTPTEWVTEADRILADEPELTQHQIAERLGISDTYLRRCRRLTREGHGND